MVAARSLVVASVVFGMGCLDPGSSTEESADSLWSDRTIDQILPGLELRGPFDRLVTASYGRRFVGYTTTAKASDVIELDLTAPGTDPMMWIFGPRVGATWRGAARVAFSDDTNGSTDAHVTVTVPTDGEYLVVVRELRLRHGDFTLAVPCTPPVIDTTPPTLDGVRLPDSADVSRGAVTVSVEITAHDDESGITGGVSFGLTAPSGRSSLYGTAEATDTAGVYRASLIVPPGSEPGDHRISWISISDATGNYTSTGTVDGAVLRVVNTSGVDSKPPTVDEIAPIGLDGPVDVTTEPVSVLLAVDVDDDLSGVSGGVSLGLSSPSGLRAVYGMSDPRSGRATIVFPEGSEAGRYQLDYVSVSDRVGNTVYADLSNPTAAGLDIREVGIEVVNRGTADGKPPVVDDVRTSLDTVELADAPVELVIEIAADDDVSGIAGGVWIAFAPPSGQRTHYAYATPAFGEDGIEIPGLYRASILLHEQSEPGVYRVVYMAAGDTAGNWATADALSPTALGFDIRDLTVTVVGVCGR